MPQRNIKLSLLLLSALILVEWTFPHMARGQPVSFLRLAQKQSAYGFGIQFMEDSRIISGALEFGMSTGTKFYGVGGIGFIDQDALNTGFETPPAPVAELGLMHTEPLQQTGFDFFITGAGAAAFSRLLYDDEPRLNTTTLGLATAGGLLRRIEMDSGMKLTPYFGVEYSHVWLTIINEQLKSNRKETEDEGYIGGKLGMELHVSSSVIARATFSFSFEDSDTDFTLGLTFH